MADSVDGGPGSRKRTWAQTDIRLAIYQCLSIDLRADLSPSLTISQPHASLLIYLYETVFCGFWMIYCNVTSGQPPFEGSAEAKAVSQAVTISARGIGSIVTLPFAVVGTDRRTDARCYK